MSKEEFEVLYAKSLELMDAYIAKQSSNKTKAVAAHRKHNVEINKGYFEHQSAAVYLCKHCGAMSTDSYSEPTKTQMREGQVCFGCNHWEQIASCPHPDMLIIDGDVYSDAGRKLEPGNGHSLGHAGRKFIIKQGDRTWMTNNLWHDGTVPEEFRDRLPNNAEFVKGV